MPRKYNFWSFCQDIVAVSLAVPTYGASMVISPTARKMVGVGFSGDEEGSNKNLETFKLQNEQWKTLLEERRAEVEQLRKDRASKEGKIKHNNDEVARLNSIINNPNSSDEERTNARKRIVLLETDNKNLKREIEQINKNIEDKSKTPPAPSKPWSFPKLSLVDKTLIAGGTVLLLYLLIPSKKRD